MRKRARLRWGTSQAAQTLHLLNQRYRQEFDRAERLAAELRDLRSSRLWPIFHWLRQWWRGGRWWQRLFRLGAATAGTAPAQPTPGRGFFTPLTPQPKPRDWSYSLIIPFRDQIDLLVRCLRAVRRTTVAEQPEIVLIDNGSTDPLLQRSLRRWRERGRGVLLSRPGPFNFAALCNAGARVAAGEILVFLNNDVEPLHPGWLREMGQLLTDEQIGAAGATLLYPDGTIQHVGLQRDQHGQWHHPYRFAPASTAGHDGELLQLHVVPAATAACLAITRERFLAVGGFDESLPVVGNDVDLCLRLAQRGWLTVVTPAARLLHFESLTRGYAREAVA